MKSLKQIQKFEHETLYVGEYDFSLSHFNQLVSFNDKHGQKFFKVGNKKITFSSYVGVIQVSGLTIEILPKGDSNKDRKQGKEKWRTALINILSECDKIKLKGTQAANLSFNKNTLLDLYIAYFLTEVEQIIHRGLVKRYDRREGQKYALKGALHFPKHTAKNYINKERFYTKHQVYDYNHQLNKIIKTALHVLKKINISSSLLGIVNNLDLKMEEIDFIHSPAKLNQNIHYSRRTNHYREAIKIALLIIQEYSPILKSGPNEIIAFLFNMNELFEDFIYRRLKREEVNFQRIGLSVLNQKSKNFWNERTIRPDIVLKFTADNEDQNVIIDTKWKLLTEVNPSIQDLRQMFVYNLYYTSEHSVLLYPDNGVQDLAKKPFVSVDCIDKEEHGCAVSFINPFLDQGSINPNFASNLLEKLTSSNLATFSYGN